jgi:hypothetical protein
MCAYVCNIQSRLVSITVIEGFPGRAGGERCQREIECNMQRPHPTVRPVSLYPYKYGNPRIIDAGKSDINKVNLVILSTARQRFILVVSGAIEIPDFLYAIRQLTFSICNGDATFWVHTSIYSQTSIYVLNWSKMVVLITKSDMNFHRLTCEVVCLVNDLSKEIGP